LAQFAPWHAEPVAVRETLGDLEDDDGLEDEE
jgi:hypothetical protein